MSLQVEKLEKNMAKLTIEVSAEEFDKAVNQAYLKNRGSINMPGFRKGKAPRVMIEKMYGAGIFFEEAANSLIPVAYSNEIADCDLDIVSQPQIDVVQIEQGKPFIFTAEVAVKPEVTLGEYKGIEVPKTTIRVTKDEIEKEVDKERENNARTITVEDRPVEDGDITSIDFEGFVDGEAFEGGKGENFSLTIGSHSFIDTFEEQLIGKNIGEEVEVNVTFPEEYHVKELAGKPALFKVIVHEIKVKELPEADDDFAKDVSEFDTMKEYRADIKAKIREQKEKDAQTAKEDTVMEKIIENATMEIPDLMVEGQTQQMVDNFERRIQQQGLSLEQYFQFTGLTQEGLSEQMRPQALKTIQTSLVLEAIAEAEDIQVSDERMEEEIANMAKMYQMEADKLKEVMGDYEKEQIKKDLALQEAITLVTEAAKEV
ncbi:MAG TPA: trigger factor [Candidatus Merdenecus merdavium]|nr:trigger factor [Candidatus Merdenecus merdavium]